MASTYEGRFPKNEIISLVNVNRRFNLAESTAQDFTVGEVLSLANETELSSVSLGYSFSAGQPLLRRTIAEQFGVPVDSVIATQGTALSLFLLAFELCRPGDEVVLSSPCFPPSRDSLVGCGVTIREVRQSFDSGYQLDVDQIANALTSKTRFVSVASPGNPHGIAVSRGTLQRLLAIMEERAPEALLFIDETYRDATYGAESVPSAVSLGSRVIVGGSVSKAHGAPGLRVGWLIVQDSGLRERLLVAKMNIVISGSPLDETLAAILLINRDKVLIPRRTQLSKGLALVEQWVIREAGYVEWVRPEAGALCCVRLRRERFDHAAIERFWNALPAHDLQISCGAWFGEENRILRLGFGYLPENTLEEALQALSRVLAQVCDRKAA